MRNYLLDFFKEFNYNNEDARYLLGIYEKIVDNTETENLLNEALEMYDKNIHCDYKTIINLADNIAERLYLIEYSVELLVFICLSKRTRQIYENRNIDRDIFYNSMLDLKYKLEECKIVKGIVGTFVPEWFGGFFKLTRFSLGRLQFEIIPFGREYQLGEKKLIPESNVINVHIPRTMTPLDEKSCDDSFKMAKSFFADKIADNCAFVCNSWLLYPENNKILPQHTNTYRFMQRFDILSFRYYKDNGDLWRIFDTDEKNVDRLPADSSLRKAYVEHLKKGGKTGCGFGVFFM